MTNYKRNNPKFVGKISEYAFQYYASLKNIVVSFVRLGSFDSYTEYKGLTFKCQVKTAGWRGKSYIATTTIIKHKLRNSNVIPMPEYRTYTPDMCDFIILVCKPDERLKEAVFYFIPIEIAQKYSSITVAPHKTKRTKKQEYWERFRGTWEVLKGVINLTEAV